MSDNTDRDALAEVLREVGVDPAYVGGHGLRLTAALKGDDDD